MNLSALIEEDKLIRAKYDYYRSLGYTDYAAAVFSTVTYGESRTVLLAQKYGADTTRLVSNLYEWLKNKPDKKLREPEDFEEIKYRAMPTMARKSIFPDAVSYRLHASAPMRTAQKEVQHMKMGQMLPLVDSEPLEETADFSVAADTGIRGSPAAVALDEGGNHTVLKRIAEVEDIGSPVDADHDRTYHGNRQ